MVASNEDAATGATRKGDRAWYFWQYPNLMINCYEGYMDTNYVIPVDADHCSVVFDFYFGDVSEARRAYNTESVNVGNRVQDEDLGICEDVQRGLKSRAYGAGASFCTSRGGGAIISSAAGVGFERRSRCRRCRGLTSVLCILLAAPWRGDRFRVARPFCRDDCAPALVPWRLA